ncbi:MAG: hypothetical protein RLZZ628_4481 [Bacteroidota bacterium]|jgi:hypothetical protein
MVVIKLYTEGGAHPHTNPNAMTVTNTAALRESLNKLFNAAFSIEKVRVECILCGSDVGTKKAFMKSATGNNYLLIDLDGERDSKTTKLTAFDLLEVASKVFFMVQSMESWLLSQPQRLQIGLSARYIKHSLIELADDILIVGKSIEQISNADAVLDKLLKNHFHQKNGDVLKPLKYGKLKNAHEIIELLDIHELRNAFIEVDDLLCTIERII